MANDEALFLARRLGYGLRDGEAVSGSFRDWAVAQLKAIPPLDFYGPDGTNIRSKFPAEAEPIKDFAEACKAFEIYRKTIEVTQKRGRSIPQQEFNKLMDSKVQRPFKYFPLWRDCLVSVLTAVNGPSPVFERFWAFWVNHFTVASTNSEIELFVGPHGRNIRRRMTGKFGDMLHDAVINPAMLTYLDNVQSTGPHSPQGKQHDGNLNENLAREVLELHTMSPSGGYTQKDVVEAALALTGWQLYAGRATHPQPEPGEPYGPFFHVYRHEPGARTVMGKTYSGTDQGRNQAAEMLADFAAHPQTAKHLSWKLLRHFLADDPPAESIARIEQVWNRTSGDLVAIHTAVIDEVLAKGHDTAKFTTPQNWLIQSLRVTGAEVPTSTPYPGTGHFWIDGLLEELGQSYNKCPQPNGWSDLKADWISKEMLDRRLRLSYILGSQLMGLKADFIVSYAERLAGKESDLAQMVARAPSIREATTLLLCSPQFLNV